MSATTAETARSRRSRPPRKRALWRDPAGRFSWLKAATLLLVVLPGLAVAAGFAAGTLGSRPYTEAIHQFGDWAVRFVLVALAVTPARAVFDWSRVLLLRRMLGVTAACYAGCHFLLYCTDQQWQLGKVASEIVHRVYLTIGFVALCGLLALAITSLDSAVRRMGRSWLVLHRLIYFLAALAILHYFIQSKANVTDAVFVAGLYAWLMLFRLLPRKWQVRLWVLPVLAVAAALATAGIEALWYALATGANVQRVLAANLNVAFGPRPAVLVLELGVALFMVAGARRGIVLLRKRVAARARGSDRVGAGLRE